MLVRPLGHSAVCGFAPLARNPLLSVSSVILLGTESLLAPKNVGHNLRETSHNAQFRPTALLKQISEGVNGSSLSFCCRLHSPWFCFSAALFVVAPFADLTSRNHFCQFTVIFLTILRSRFWDRQAVQIFGPQPLTPIVSLSTASPGHVQHLSSACCCSAFSSLAWSSGQPKGETRDTLSLEHFSLKPACNSERGSAEQLAKRLAKQHDG